MDLLSKLNIVEKNITILIANLIHQFRIDALNKEYHATFILNFKFYLCYNRKGYEFKNILFNYRGLERFYIYKVFRKGNYYNSVTKYELPRNYHYSSAKFNPCGFK